MLGLTFKPGTDDLREAPSLVIIPILLDDGAKVNAWDPVGATNFKKAMPNEAIVYFQTIEEAIRDADLCFILTNWQDILSFDITKFKALMKNPIVLDGRNCFRPSDFKNTGITYASIGRQSVDEGIEK